MRYKTVTLQKMDQIDADIKRLEFQLNRNVSPDEMSDTVEVLKAKVEELRNLISIEHDDFPREFNNY